MDIEQLELLAKLADTNDQLVDAHWQIVALIYEIMMPKDDDEPENKVTFQ